ncbi:MBL fold metallo-hydrolase [Kitasatospora sp. NPDC049285]|uniref:ComEC/Rec2 family competence protein n=1 Tax=Kitasatospora sp. NPDC049285 TaxID=3157096 RepID=UPI0034317849
MTTLQAPAALNPTAVINTVEAVILDVGHGNSAVLRDGNRCVVVDAKSDKLLYSTLVDAGIHRIEHLVLSHADTDHIQGALRLVTNRRFQIGTVWANSDSSKDTRKWDELLAILTDQVDSGQLLVRIGISNADGSQLSLDRVGIRILHPTLRDIGHGPGARGKFRPEITTNGMSVVLQVSLDGHPALFLPGDLDASGLEDLLQRGDDLNSHTLVYPHHGGHSGAAQEEQFAKLLCDAITPEVVIFSLGRGKYSNPLREVVDEIRTNFPSVRMACTQLSTNCHASLPPQASKGHLANWPAAGRSAGTSCAGTFRITVEGGSISIEPPMDRHHEWIRSHVSQPMCIRTINLPAPRVP